MAVKVKICGLTNVEDAIFAEDNGADYLGFIFHEQSPRNVAVVDVKNIVDALKGTAKTVGVFVDKPSEFVNDVAQRAGLDMVQLHGNETPEYVQKIEKPVIKVFRVFDNFDLEQMKQFDNKFFLLDTYSKDMHGGTGEVFDWDIAVRAKEFGEIFLSGGLAPENIEDAVKHVSPFAVDVSSGVEESKGKKDLDKAKQFIDKVKSL